MLGGRSAARVLFLAIKVGDSASSAGDGFDQIPPVAIDVFEDSHDAIGFMPGCLDEANTLPRVGEVVPGKVVRFEEQEHATAALVADRFALPVADSPRQ